MTIPISRPFALLLAATMGAHALSGTVYDPEKTPLADVRVVSVTSGASAWSDATGHWSLGSATRTPRRAPQPAPSGIKLLRMEKGTLALSLAGRTLDGRIAAGTASMNVAPSALGPAARISATKDTLLFVYEGLVLARREVDLETDPLFLDNLDTSGVEGALWRRDRTYGLLRDTRDGRTYRTIAAAGKTWMAENLDHQPQGVSIPWVAGSIDSGMKYGRLYTWTQALGLADSCTARSCSSLVNVSSRGLCPAGWHLPSEDDWTDLAAAAGGGQKGGLNLRSVGGWKADAVGTDSLGVRLLGSGRRDTDGAHRYQGTDGYYWTSTETSRFDAVQRNLSYDEDYLYQGTGKTDGFAVRCIAD